MAKTKQKGKGKAKAAPEPEEIEDEVEELADDEEETTPSKSKGSDEVEFGVSDLCAYIKRKTGKEYSTREMRTLLRKMAREKNPRVTRDIVPGNKARWSWTGPGDPEVKQVLKAVQGGEIEAGKKEALDALKAKKAKSTTEKAAKGKKKGKAKAAESDDDDDVEEIEDLDDDEDE